MVKVQPNIKLFTASEVKTGISDWPKTTHARAAHSEKRYFTLSAMPHTGTANPVLVQGGTAGLAELSLGQQEHQHLGQVFSKDIPPVKIEFKL